MSGLNPTKAETMMSIFMKISAALALVILVVFPVSFLWIAFLFSLFICSFVVDCFSSLYRYVDIKSFIQKLE